MSGIFGMAGGTGGVEALQGIMSIVGGSKDSMIGSFLNKILSQVMQSAVESVAKELKLPDVVKDAMQLSIADAFGDKEGVKQNRQEIMDDFKKMSGASDSDMGTVDREATKLEEAYKKGFNDAIQQEADRSNGTKKKNGNTSSGSGAAGGAAAGAGTGAAGGAASGGTDAAGGAGASESTKGTENASNPGNVEGKEDNGGVDWFTKIAYALAKGAQKQADKVASKSDALTNAMDAAAAKPDDKKLANEQMKLQTELQAESSKLGFLMTALNATINSLGEAMKTAAQVK